MGSRRLSARSASRAPCVGARDVGSRMSASACSLDIAAKARSKSSGPRASRGWRWTPGDPGRDRQLLEGGSTWGSGPYRTATRASLRDLRQQLQALRAQLEAQRRESRDVAARSGEVGHQPHLDGAIPERQHDLDRRRRPAHGLRELGPPDDDDVRLEPDHLGQRDGHAGRSSLRHSGIRRRCSGPRRSPDHAGPDGSLRPERSRETRRPARRSAAPSRVAARRSREVQPPGRRPG